MLPPFDISAQLNYICANNFEFNFRTFAFPRSAGEQRAVTVKRPPTRPFRSCSIVFGRKPPTACAHCESAFYRIGAANRRRARPFTFRKIEKRRSLYLARFASFHFALFTCTGGSRFDSLSLVHLWQCVLSSKSSMFQCRQLDVGSDPRERHARSILKLFSSCTGNSILLSVVDQIRNGYLKKIIASLI